MTPDRASLEAFAAVAEAVRATRRRLEKVALVAAHLAVLDDAALAVAARFFSGTVFARADARTTGVGWRLVLDALATVTGVAAGALGERYVAFGDLGDLAGDAMAGRPASHMPLVEVAARFATLAAAPGRHARRAILAELFTGLGALETRYAVKLLGGELRIGLKEAQVEEGLALAFARPLADVRRAALLRGDVGEVAVLARRGALGTATLALFHPIGFMLAQPLATPEEVVATLPSPFVVEDKYDGIRAQAHVAGGQVALFSRTLDDVTRGYPEVAAALARAPDGCILDGELVAWDAAAPERAAPFLVLQRRLGRVRPAAALLAAVPVRYVVFDLLAWSGALVIDLPWHARRDRLAALTWSDSAIVLAPARRVADAAAVEAAFGAARDAGNEGLVAKDPTSPYVPGRRGKTWIKLKRPLATLDVVVTAVERGHGRRRDVLSDYTFAVRAGEDDPTLLDIGKAYSGLTDAEIAALTRRFEALTLEQRGGWHRVEPVVVLEVAFDVVQRSTRHASGYALRFPRIVRVRDDKPVGAIDTLARVRALAGEAAASSAAAE